MYLETNAKYCRNFVKFNTRDLTLMYEVTIKKCLPEWDKVTPIMKKWDFDAWNSFVSITKLLFRWIEVGWTKVALALHMRKAFISSCNLLLKEVDRMMTKNIFVIASIVWTWDDKCWTTYEIIWCVMGLRRIIPNGYDMVNWQTCRGGLNMNHLM